ncbi:laccase-14-like [Mangifera indica]|uniref:laccase-14-like n=1 Tax=Mangifera indica TaxID=29780 RepID=UPI001CF98AB6|nr:laccase-14-like [Mangifera indica]
MNKQIILFILGFFFLDGLLQCMAVKKNYTFVLKEKTFTRLCSTKSMLTVNGKFPGPTIKARKGDTIFVNVINQGNYSVTIHWHGVNQPRNPWSDGPENVTQCPIKPGANFTYEIIFSTEEGTLWWHAHSDWTRVSVHGAIIILPAAGKSYPFPRPHKQETIIIGSWYKLDVPKMLANVLKGVIPNVSDAYTINGQPGDLYNCSKDSTHRLKVKFGKTYLLRMVNAGMNEENFFGIANHSLTVVGHDGAYVKPITTDYILIIPGQTMDVLFTANQNLSHYYLAASPYSDGNSTTVLFDNTTTTAIVEYDGNYSRPPTPFFPNLPFYSDINAAVNFTNRIRSLANDAYPANVPKNITTQLLITVAVNRVLCPNDSCLTPAGDGFLDNKQAASLNNVSFATPQVSILDAYYSGLSNVFVGDFPSQPSNFFNFTGDDVSNLQNTASGTKARFINYGEAVEIVFQGTNIQTPETHPLHIHGYSFFVVGTGFGNFNNETDPLYYNLIDPPELNTVNVPRNGWTAVRFFAINPGVWFMHCHLERHATWGMDTVFIVRNGQSEDQKIRPPPANMPSCS